MRNVWMVSTGVWYIKRMPMYSIVQKVQKTPPEGYHVWHDENSSLEHCKRVGMDGLLNDDFKGGETEFLYYKRREQPERKVIIMAVGYTHTHRGGMVLEGNKYVITGWFYLGGYE